MQAIQQGMVGIEQVAGATIKGFRMWRANDSTTVFKFSVDKATRSYMAWCKYYHSSLFSKLG
jgi:hypothetical protein